MTPRETLNATVEDLGAGWRVARLGSVGSTNDEARRHALAGDPGRLWIVAQEQTQGRGRRGRVWTSRPGNLYASALLINPAPVAVTAQIGFVAGVALRRALDDLGGADEIKLKWPNDLVWRGAKLAGLLVEGVALNSGGLACIVGIGVNCADAPKGLAYPTASLSEALDRPISADHLFARLAPNFEDALAEWSQGGGFGATRARWLAQAAGLGGRIRVAGPQGFREGTFQNLDEHGRLILDGANGPETIEAGDLFLVDESAGR